MLRELAQIVLSFAGFVASFFVSSKSTNFSFIQMAVALVLLIICSLLIWWIPQLFRRNKP